ncbi:MAG: YigZ family protein [Spirochaetales bacterium]|nr:YigZ family protein [Spirochaetales bacterium]
MLIPDGTSRFELIIKRSRFIAEAVSVRSPDDARMLLKEKRLEHPDANHVVHAFIVGEQRQFMGLSDDGEPSGTSGKPVLEVLKGRGITNIMLTVVRYFGGTKLGTGGLVKAYSEAAKGVLEHLSVKELVKYKRFECRIEYSLYEPLKKVILGFNGKIDDERFETDVFIQGIIPLRSSESFKHQIVEISMGQAALTISEDMFQA